MKTILFLHGWGTDEKSFAHIRPFFESNCRCIFVNFDCNPKTVMTLDDYVDEVEARFLNEVKGSCCIIAHSFGARVAVLLANRNPNLIEKMVLTGAAGIKPRFSLKIWLKIKWFKLTGLGNGSIDYQILSATGKKTFQNIIQRDLKRELAKLYVPTLLIWGKLDKFTPLYMGKIWTKLQKTATMKIYKAAGHFCFIDDPACFITDSWGFLCTAQSSDGGVYVRT